MVKNFKSVISKTFSLIFAKSDGDVRILITAIPYEMEV